MIFAAAFETETALAELAPHSLGLLLFCLNYRATVDPGAES